MFRGRGSRRGARTLYWVILGSMFMTELGLERELQVAGKHAVLGSSEIPRKDFEFDLGA